jgi:hypothetical protein
MRQISSMLQGLARSMSLGKERKAGDDKEEEEQGTVLRTSGTLWGEGSETFAAVCSRRGEKGTNQDCSIVWEVSEFVRSFDRSPLLCFFTLSLALVGTWKLEPRCCHGGDMVVVTLAFLSV